MLPTPNFGIMKSVHKKKITFTSAPWLKIEAIAINNEECTQEEEDYISSNFEQPTLGQ
jgi:hypothetical protein